MYYTCLIESVVTLKIEDDKRYVILTLLFIRRGEIIGITVDQHYVTLLTK